MKAVSNPVNRQHVLPNEEILASKKQRNPVEQKNRGKVELHSPLLSVASGWRLLFSLHRSAARGHGEAEQDASLAVAGPLYTHGRPTTRTDN